MTDQLPDKVSYQTLALEKLRMGLETHISEQLLNDAKVDIEKILYDMVSVRIRGHIWAQHLGTHTITWDTPADWWQAFKERWFPVWARRKWPIQRETRTYTLDVKATYPALRLSVPNQEHRMVVLDRMEIQRPHRKWTISDD